MKSMIFKRLFRYVKAATISVCALTVLLGCNNSLAEKNSAVCTLNLSLNMGAAVPSNFFGADSSARTATAGFSGLDFTITAIKGTSTYTKTISSAESTQTFSIQVGEAGEYEITVTATNSAGTEAFSATKTATITANSSTPLEITITPTQNGNGSVNLPFTDETSKIAVVTVTMDATIGNTSYTGMSNAPFSGGSATLNIIDTVSGVYTTVFAFEDAAGNTLYSCKEIINIYDGFTTDTWYGNAPYLKDGSFTITSALLSAYAAETVPDTKLVLYNYTAQGTNGANNSYYDYYVVGSATSSLSAPTKCNVSSSYGSGYTDAMPPAFAFDKNGTLYLASVEGDNLAIINTDTGATASTITNIGLKIYMSVDLVTNVFYVLSFNEMAALYQFSSLTDNWASDYETYYINQPDDLESTLEGAPFAVHNNMFYTALRVYDQDQQEQETKICIIKAEIPETQKSDDDSNVQAEIVATLSSSSLPELSYNASVTDILFQDYSLYLLIKDSADGEWPVAEGSRVYSRGYLVKYDVLSGDVSTLGYSGDYMQNTSLNAIKMQAYAHPTDTTYFPLYKDTGYENPLIVTGNSYYYRSSEVSQDSEPETTYFHEVLPSFYNPNAGSATLDDFAFYGPSKFIAIKPKKLVIADDGYAFYTNDGWLCYKNVNRVITVDLENFSISSIQNVSVGFGTETSGNYYSASIACGASGFLSEPENNIGSAFYDNNGNNAVAINSTSNNIYLGIKEE